MMTKNQKYLIGLGAVIVVLVCIAIFNANKKPAAQYTLPAGERPFRGRADAAVVVDEYGDFQCPACRLAAPLVAQLDQKYGSNIRINFKNFPLESIHRNALSAALAAECANDQGKFWQMHDVIYDRQADGLTDGNLRKFAETVGLNMEQYDACYDSQARLSVIRKDQQDGDALGINGTPTFVINGKTQVGLRDLESEIRKALGLPAETAQ